jgi:hypothetical protein
MIQLPPEKTGSFYLGAEYDVTNKMILPETINYDARDLTTHAVCVGMTGSGKTGLCIGLLEEAAIDRVPAIIIDPKGDMTNLLLQFEQLDKSDFIDWINADDASRKDMTIDAYAESIANKWKKGLGDWGQTQDRISLLKQSVDYTIYTPGSNSGIPINIMGSFAAPKVDFEEEAEMLRERIQGTVAALLGMIQNNADPVRSREGILLSNLFEHYWRLNEDLDLAKIIKGIQSPPMKQLGVFDIETFFPQKDRFDLAMSFNTLIASPQFKYWLEGEDLDIDKLYFTESGQPRHSIIYIAHLSESERMFFVTLLLNSLITWMRRQSGTTSLRSLLYFDEIFGYFPPTANPPSKKPLLTILKQARAYGVGAVLVTQNPVDIDYKGLSNAGTWFIGKLQTERDKHRVLEGLKGAIAEAGSNSNNDFDKIITSLSSRVFLMHNVHADAPVVYHTRWAMSYLRGPLTRPQIKSLMQNKRASLENHRVRPHISSTAAPSTKTLEVEVAPSIDPKIEQKYFAVWKSSSEVGISGDDHSIVYEPHIFATARVKYVDDKRNVDMEDEIALLVPPPDEFARVAWDKGIQVSKWSQSLYDKPDHPDNVGIKYEDVPSGMNTASEIKSIEKSLSNWLYEEKRYFLQQNEELELYKSSEETDNAFQMRISLKARELRDEQIDNLHDQYEKKFIKLEEKVRREKRDLDEAEAEQRSRRNDELFNVVENVFGGIFGGRRRRSSSMSTKRRMARKAKEKVRASEEDLYELQIAKEDLERELQEKVDVIRSKWEEKESAISKKEIKPRRSDVIIDKVRLAWYPYWIGHGIKEAAGK